MKISMITKNKFFELLPYIVLLTIALSILVISWFAEPGNSLFYPPCLFKTFTGLYCPICGSARSLHALTHGHILQALRHNFLFVISFLFGVYVLFAKIIEIVFDKKLPIPRFPVWSLWIIIGVLIVFWVLRNIPIYPFTLLAP